MTPHDENPRLGRALGAMERGREAQAVFQYLESYLVGRQQLLDQELFKAPPEEWDHIVRQKVEAHRFVQNLAQTMKAGQGSARVLQPLMERGLSDETEAP